MIKMVTISVAETAEFLSPTRESMTDDERALLVHRREGDPDEF